MSEQDNDKANTSSGKTPTDSKEAVQPSGYRGDNPATAGPGKTDVVSNTPENREGHLSPSAPEDSNTTPGSTSVK